MKKNLKWILILSAIWGCGSQPVNDQQPGIIHWAGKDSLQWSDFKGKPPLFTNHDARTFSGLGCKERFIQNMAYVKVTAEFARDSSWVRLSNPGINLLVHERGHFNITEITARMIRKDLSDWKYPDRKEVNNYNCYNPEYDYVEDMSSLNRKYDSATDHGLNHSQQMKWNIRIDSLLEIYAPYSDAEVGIPLRN